MKTRAARTHFRRDGVVYVLALLLICIFSSLAVAFISTTDLALCKGNNTRLGLDARLAAESGLNYLTFLVTAESLPPGSAGQAMLDNLATSLADRLDGTGNLGETTVTYDGTTISVPQISLGDLRSFTAEITLESGNLKLSVTGQSPVIHQSADQMLARTMSVDLESNRKDPTDFGIFSKGPIAIEMNLNMIGANDSEEGSIYSAATGNAITIDTGYIDGNVYTSDPSAVIDCGATVNGDIQTEVPEVPMPTVDGAIFAPFAVDIIDGSIDTIANDQTYENIRIAAGTNPEFGNNTTIKGVMYVEAPNVVTFSNSVDFTGVIVTEDPGEGADPDLHQIIFNNNLTLEGIEDLEDSSAFEDLKQYEGAAVIAPGFSLDFKNNFTSISGTIAAESITLKNNLEGTVYGSLIILGDDGVDFKNNSALTIDQSRYVGTAPGITEVQLPVDLIVRPVSYTEG